MDIGNVLAFNYWYKLMRFIF